MAPSNRALHPKPLSLVTFLCDICTYTPPNHVPYTLFLTPNPALRILPHLLPPPRHPRTRELFPRRPTLPHPRPHRAAPHARLRQKTHPACKAQLQLLVRFCGASACDCFVLELGREVPCVRTEDRDVVRGLGRDCNVHDGSNATAPNDGQEDHLGCVVATLQASTHPHTRVGPAGNRLDEHFLVANLHHKHGVCVSVVTSWCAFYSAAYNPSADSLAYEE